MQLAGRMLRPCAKNTIYELDTFLGSSLPGYFDNGVPENNHGHAEHYQNISLFAFCHLYSHCRNHLLFVFRNQLSQEKNVPQKAISK